MSRAFSLTVGLAIGHVLFYVIGIELTREFDLGLALCVIGAYINQYNRQRKIADDIKAEVESIRRLVRREAPR